MDENQDSISLHPFELAQNFENRLDILTSYSFLEIELELEIIWKIMVIRLGAWVILIGIRPPIRHTRLVKVMICQVSNIRKRDRGVIWITIKIEKIIIINHNTQEMLNTNKEKQTN